jgi:hypothetical protein
MGVGVTGLPFMCSIKLLGYKQCWNCHQPDCFCLRISGQTTDPNAAIYQNCLALDYLLAEERGICGKFNHSDCYLQIDDNGQVVTNTAINIRKLIHILVQTWDGWKPHNWLGGWFSWLFPLLGPIAVIRLSCASVHVSLTFSCVSFLLS